MANEYNFTLDQGSNHSFEIEYKNSDNTIFDLTGYSAKLHVRESYNSAILIELLSPTDILITPLEGKLEINFSPSKTINLNRELKNLIYDLEIFLGVDNVTRIIQGKILFSPEVTR
jgi:hypothetical protein